MAQFQSKEEYEKWKADRAALAMRKESTSTISQEQLKLRSDNPGSSSKPRSIKIVAALIIIYALFAIAVSAGSFTLYTLLPENAKAEFLAKSRPFEASTVDQFSSKVFPYILFVSSVSTVLLLSGIGIIKFKSWARRFILIFCIFVCITAFPSLLVRPSMTVFLHAAGCTTLSIYLMHPRIKELFQ